VNDFIDLPLLASLQQLNSVIVRVDLSSSMASRFATCEDYARWESERP
jgi:hypothetical protein